MGWLREEKIMAITPDQGKDVPWILKNAISV